MNAHGVGGVFRTAILVISVFLFGYLVTVKWGNITIRSATAVIPMIQLTNNNGERNQLTLESLEESPIDQRDPSLLPLVRKVLVPPSSLPYNLDNEGEHSHGQAQLIKRLFKGKVTL